MNRRDMTRLRRRPATTGAGRPGRPATALVSLLAGLAVVCGLAAVGLSLTGAQGTAALAESPGPTTRANTDGQHDPGTSAHRPGVPTASHRQQPGEARRILIPALGVSAPVIGVTAAGGVLRPPDDPQQIGWWDGGARPGAAHGSAVLTGHTVHAGGGAFDDLDRLRAGDRVEVVTAGGILRYRVHVVSRYSKAGLAQHRAELFDRSGPARLVLVTCDGWDGTSYLSNAVVVAVPSR